MWQRKSIEITVGLFMLAGLAALLMMALRVSGLNDVYTRTPGYTITAVFDNAGGLKPKAKVTIAGVSVGRVISIGLEKGSYLAEVTIRVNDKVDDIPDDSHASILTAGLLGDNYIGLTPGFSETFLKAGSRIPETQTDSAVILENLISKFLSSKASESGPAGQVGSEKNVSEPAPMPH